MRRPGRFIFIPATAFDGFFMGAGIQRSPNVLPKVREDTEIQKSSSRQFSFTTRSPAPESSFAATPRPGISLREKVPS